MDIFSDVSKSVYAVSNMLSEIIKQKIAVAIIYKQEIQDLIALCSNKPGISRKTHVLSSGKRILPCIVCSPMEFDNRRRNILTGAVGSTSHGTIILGKSRRGKLGNNVTRDGTSPLWNPQSNMSLNILLARMNCSIPSTATPSNPRFIAISRNPPAMGPMVREMIATRFTEPPKPPTRAPFTLAASKYHSKWDLYHYRYQNLLHDIHQQVDLYVCCLRCCISPKFV